MTPPGSASVFGCRAGGITLEISVQSGSGESGVVEEACDENQVGRHNSILAP